MLSTHTVIATGTGCKKWGVKWLNFYNENPGVCAVAVLMKSECHKNFFVHHTDNNCACWYTDVDCSDTSEQYSNNAMTLYRITEQYVPVVTLMHSGNRCNPNAWNYYTQDPRACAAHCFNHPTGSAGEKSKVWFNWAGGDGRCGCVGDTSPTYDCASNLASVSAATGVYQITGGGSLL